MLMFNRRYLRHSFIPTTDNFLLADLEFEGLASVPRGVERVAVRQRSCRGTKTVLINVNKSRLSPCLENHGACLEDAP